MFFVALLLTVAEIYLIIAAVAVVLWGLIEAFYFIKERAKNRRFYKIHKILRKRSNGEIQAIIVIVNPDGSIQIALEKESFSESQMKGTSIAKAFEQAERNPKSQIDGDPSIDWTPDKQEEDAIRIQAGR